MPGLWVLPSANCHVWYTGTPAGNAPPRRGLVYAMGQMVDQIWGQ